jgi:hypothetical protein
MKSTKIMVAVIATFILTWMSFGLLVYLLSSSMSYREVMIQPGVIMTTFFVGWIPSVIVGCDLHDRL